MRPVEIYKEQRFVVGNFGETDMQMSAMTNGVLIGIIASLASRDLMERLVVEDGISKGYCVF